MWTGKELDMCGVVLNIEYGSGIELGPRSATFFASATGFSVNKRIYYLRTSHSYFGSIKSYFLRYPFLVLRKPL